MLTLFFYNEFAWGDNMSIMGDRIKSLRKGKGMTQQQLGDILNVTKVSICCYEKGTRIPAFDTLTELSRIFDVTLDYFAGNDTFVISEDSSDYGEKIANEELEIIKELRKSANANLYDKLLKDPKRTIELINKKLR